MLNDTNSIFLEAIALLITGDKDILEIVLLSLYVTLSAVILSCLFSIPLSAILTIKNFIGKTVIIIISNSLMALPPVVVGLGLYLIISANGILAAYELLYTPSAMIIAQFIILTPIVIALSRQNIQESYVKYDEYLNSLGTSTTKKIKTLIWETRFSLITNALAALGRGLSEVGAVIIVGGNIAHQTRMMTTTIAMETSRGDLRLALAVGIILIFISITINIALYILKIKLEVKDER